MSNRTYACLDCRKLQRKPAQRDTVLCPLCRRECIGVHWKLHVPAPRKRRKWEAFWKQYPDQAPKPGDRDKAMDQNLYRVRAQQHLVGLPPNWTKEQVLAQQWGLQTLEAWTRMQDNLLRVGSLNKKVDPNRLFDNQFIAYANGFDRAKIMALAGSK